VTLSQGELAESLAVRAYSDDGSLREDNPLTRFGARMTDALIATGRAAPSEELLRKRLEKAGFADVQSFTIRLPVGPWAKDKFEPCNIVKTANTHHVVEIGPSRSLVL
jgi:hypothetical protein